MALARQMDEYGKPAWIAAIVLAFWAFWPAGVALLVFLVMSGRLRGWRRAPGRWHGERTSSWSSWFAARPETSGNGAFDEYRADTLRRLEEEQREFRDYLERLRRARDKAEFDEFMSERQRRQAPVAG